MKHFLLLSIGLFFTLSSINAANYRIDDQALNQVFSSAQTISIATVGINSIPGMADMATTTLASAGREKDPLVAILLDIFVGTLGVHRFYLGTAPLTGIGYILTCGGIFGIVPLVDLIILAVDYEDISPYVDNTKFFMW